MLEKILTGEIDILSVSIDIAISLAIIGVALGGVIRIIREALKEKIQNN